MRCTPIVIAAPDTSGTHRFARDDLTYSSAWCMEYVSMNHAITCSFVPMLGAITSMCGPTKGIISCIYLRDRASSSRIESCRGSTVMPHLAPPQGSPASAHFQLIQTAKAATSPLSRWIGQEIVIALFG
jgi:hypothetical protein